MFSCACLQHEAPAALRGTSRRAAGAVAFLLVDAEGHDHEVLRSYPFATVPTWRVNFEAFHMPNAEYNRTAALLHSHGFEKLYGGPKAFSNSWHNTQSREVLLS